MKFKRLRLSISKAMIMFINMVKFQNIIPFDIKVPNKKTLKAMKEAKEFKAK